MRRGPGALAADSDDLFGRGAGPDADGRRGPGGRGQRAAGPGDHRRCTQCRRAFAARGALSLRHLQEATPSGWATWNPTLTRRSLTHVRASQTRRRPRFASSRVALRPAGAARGHPDRTDQRRPRRGCDDRGGQPS